MKDDKITYIGIFLLYLYMQTLITYLEKTNVLKKLKS